MMKPRIYGKYIFILPVLCACIGETDLQQEKSQYDLCLPVTGSETLEIITWNLQDFPKNGIRTIEIIAGIINDLNPDLLALQEINEPGDLQELLRQLPGWTGITGASTERNPAFLVKGEAINGILAYHEIFTDDPFHFPRPALHIQLMLKNDSVLNMLNIHLKCCDGAENMERRAGAMKKLKLFADSLTSGSLILLGDFNDFIDYGDIQNSIFKTFLYDGSPYFLADSLIATGHPAFWSYPIWPSHLDHFIVSRTWKDHLLDVRCLLLDQCDTAYLGTVSDHRPVMIKFGK